MSNDHDMLDADFQNILQKMSVALTLSDAAIPDVPLVAANDAFLEFCGYDLNEVIGRNCRFLQGDRKNDVARADLRDAIENRSRVQVLLRNRHKDGTDISNFLTLVPITSIAGKRTFFLGAQFSLTDNEMALIERQSSSQSDRTSTAFSRHRRLMFEQRRIKIDAVARMVQSHCLMRQL